MSRELEATPMLETMRDDRRADAAVEAGGTLWSVILAGGEGRRLRPLVRHVHGEPRPKQYSILVGTRSLLRQTLERAGLLIPEQCCVVVSLERHQRHLDTALGPDTPSVLLQPQDRGTAAAILLPAHFIARRDRKATVAVFPSDHYVDDDRRFMAHVADAAAFVALHPERILLVGVEAVAPETEYGWIEPGPELGRAGSTTILTVRRFAEKPSPADARAYLAAGALWNTFVIVARATTLVDLGRRHTPAVHQRLAAVAPFVGTDWERAALRRAYSALPPASFSSSVLERCAPRLAVSRLNGVTWCDWGASRRVVQTLRDAGLEPSWLSSFTPDPLT